MKRYYYLIAVSAAFFVSQTFGSITADVAVARADAGSALDAYNAGCADCSSAFDILADMRTAQTEYFSEACKLESLARNYASEYSVLKLRVDNFKTAFAAEIDNMKISAANMADIVKNFPLATDAISSAEKSLAECAKIVASAPGDDFQDKRYFDSVRSDFMRAVKNLRSAETRASRLIVSATIASPRIEGSEKSLKTAEEYQKKISDINAENSARVEKIAAVAQSCGELCGGFVKSYAEIFAESKSARANTASALAKYSAFMLNGIGASKKYPFADFARADWKPFEYAKPLPDTNGNIFRKSKLESAPEFAVAATGTFGAADTFSNSSARNVNAALARTSHRSASDIRAEVLKMCAEIVAITSEISNAVLAVETACNSLETANNSILSCERVSTSILRSAINLTGDAQSLSSEIQILSAGGETLKARNKIYSAEFEKLAKSARENFAKAQSLAEKSKSKIDEIARELK